MTQDGWIHRGVPSLTLTEAMSFASAQSILKTLPARLRTVHPERRGRFFGLVRLMGTVRRGAN
jgi:hypothetical protein